jgi:hypothetical protein
MCERGYFCIHALPINALYKTRKQSFKTDRHFTGKHLDRSENGSHNPRFASFRPTNDLSDSHPSRQWAALHPLSTQEKGMCPNNKADYLQPSRSSRTKASLVKSPVALHYG